jgi:Ca2+-binding EF-hand superfamily protein
MRFIPKRLDLLCRNHAGYLCLLSLIPGNITVEEFARVMKTSGQNPTDAEVQQIIKEVDLDGDRTINFEGKPAAHRN